MSVTGKRAEHIIIDELEAGTPPEGRQDLGARWTDGVGTHLDLPACGSTDLVILVTDQGKTLAACKAKFEPLWPAPFVGLDRPRTVEEFNRLYLCHWPPEDDRDEDTRL
jgi:hypothetical protein